MAIQKLLKTKYNADLGTAGDLKDGVDGDLGTKTLAALSTAMKSKAAPVAGAGTSGTAVAPVAGVGTGAGTAVVPAAAEVKPGTTVVDPVVDPKGTTEFKSEVKADPLSNRDQRRERQDLRRSNRRDMQNLRAGQQGQQQ